MTARGARLAAALCATGIATSCAACSCGSVQERPRDTGLVELDVGQREDWGSAPDLGAEAHVDAGRLDLGSADTTDSSAGDLGPADAGSDLGADVVDAGCREGRTACTFEWGVECVDISRNPCFCGECEYTDCAICFGGGCGDCSLELCIRGTMCTEDDERACVDTHVDPQHCGACWHACAPGQRCAAGVCWPPVDDTGTDAGRDG